MEDINTFFLHTEEPAVPDIPRCVHTGSRRTNSRGNAMKRSSKLLGVVVLAGFFGLASFASPSPLGTLLTTSSINTTGSPASKTTVEIDYGSPLVANGLAKGNVDWSPSGQWIAYDQGGNIWIVPAAGGSPVLISASVGGYSYNPKFTPDSGAITFTNYDSFYNYYTIVEVFFQESGMPWVTLLYDALNFAVSPDGQYIAYRVASTSALVLLNTATSYSHTIAPADYNPVSGLGYGSTCFSPDGSHVVTSLVTGTSMNLFAIPVAGGSAIQLTYTSDKVFNFPDYSPDGSFIVFTDNTAGNIHQFAYITDTNMVKQVFPGGSYQEGCGSFSPDGDSFTYLLCPSSTFEVYIAPFPLAQPQIRSVTLLSPTGAESMIAGDTHFIQWEYTGITSVKLEFSKDFGLNWSIIASDIDAYLGGYEWTVPDVSSTSCIVRISSMTGDVSSQSDYFAITQTSQGYVVLTAPVGGEVWEAGTTRDILWKGTASRYNIYYSTNGGSTWTSIVGGYIPGTMTSNNENIYTWTVPAQPSADCFVKVVSNWDTADYDTNTSPFTIINAIPEADQIFRYNTGYAISVSSPAVDAQGTIYIANEMNGVFAVNANGTKKWARYFDDPTLLSSVSIWASPVIEGSTLYIGSRNGYLYALNTSDGAVKWKYNAKSQIFSSAAVSTDGNIYFGTADGSFVGLKSDGTELFTPKSIGAAFFSSPAIGIDNTVYIGAGNGKLYAYSPTGSMKWIFPTGAETIFSSPAIGADGTIYIGTSTDQSSVTSNIHLGYLFAVNTDGSEKWRSWLGTLVESSPAIAPDGTIYVGASYFDTDTYSYTGSLNAVYPSDGSIKWYIDFATNIISSPLVLSGGKVIVGSSNGTYSDEYPASLFAFMPNGDVAWEFPTEGDIWSSPAIGSGGQIYVGSYDGCLYAIDSGFEPVAMASTNWPKYRQNNLNTGRVTGNAVSFVRVSSPDGGEKYLPGSSLTITWTYRNAGQIRIELSTNGGSTWSVLGTVAASAGTFSWSIPSGTSSTQCLVRITDTANSALTDVSNAVFSISQSAFITVTAPAGGETFRAGTVQTIDWTSNAVANVTLAFSTDGGTNWSQIAAGIAASAGQYQWTVPNKPSTNCRVRVSNAADSTVYGISNGAFSITSSTYIQVTSPAFGDLWIAGSKRDITWTFSGPVNVKIELSVDNGVSWTTVIASTTAATGSYSWTLPNTPKTDCYIRITDSANATTAGTSAKFSIIKPDLAITHTPIQSADENDSIIFTAEITSTAAIEEAKLLYDATGSRNFLQHAINLQNISGNTWRATLQEGVFTAQGIEYYIWAKDANNRTTRSPDVKYYSITANVSDIKSTDTITGGSAQNAYRMISVPLDLQATSLSTQLAGALPSESRGEDWRLFWFDPALSHYKEFDPDNGDMAGFEPGKAFWIITRNNFRLTAPQGATVPTSESFTITLKAGWNDVANPWMFDISWDNIENPSGAQLSSLYEYDGFWSNPMASPAIMKPWKGYAVNNFSNMNVVIKLLPIPANAAKLTDSTSKTPAVPIAKQAVQPPESWLLGIVARAGEASDRANYAGVRTGASEAWDPFDHLEPPAVGDYVAVSFPHRDWPVFPQVYTVDIRPPDEEKLRWAFDVETNIPKETVTVTLDGLETLPEGLTAAVQDRDTGDIVPVHDSVFTFLSGSKKTTRHYLLAVDDAASLDQEGLTARPVAFLAVRCYPNPFNPSTTIRYELPDGAKVIIQVFNAVGQRIYQYDLGMREAGIHEFYFEAPELTSGLYFYRVSAGSSTVTGKMLYMK
jgi:outer membrane protein assembly factor BamB